MNQLDENRKKVAALSDENNKKFAALSKVEDYANRLLGKALPLHLTEPVLDLGIVDHGITVDPFLMVGDDDVEVVAYLAEYDYDPLVRDFTRPQLVQDTFAVGRGVTLPGCRTLRGGDPGYDDVSEFRELARYTKPEDAAYAAIKEALEAKLQDALDRLRLDKSQAIKKLKELGKAFGPAPL